MSLFLALLGNRNLVVTTAIAVAVAVFGLQGARLSHAKHELVQAKLALRNPETQRTWEVEAKSARADFERCSGRATALADDIEAQNKALRSLKSEADRRLAASERELASARDAVKTARTDAVRILRARPDGEACQSALDLLRGRPQ